MGLRDVVLPVCLVVCLVISSSSRAAADEPNDTPLLATPIELGDCLTHALAPAGDRDWFTFTLAAPRSLVIETGGPDGDTHLWLFDEALDAVAFDDDGGPGACSRIEVTDLDPGRYFIKVTEDGHDAPVETCVLCLLAVAPGTIAPYVTIVIDDFGYQDPRGRNATGALLALPEEFRITAAVLPRRPYSSRAAAAFAERGQEIILHQPMEPVGYPAMNPGAGAVFAATPVEEVCAIVRENLASLGHAAGLNNHMGSRFTQEREPMYALCRELADKGLVFLDSWTSPSSVAYDAARDAGTFTAANAVFLDGAGAADAAAVVRELARGARARPNLMHVAIGHVRAPTVRALVRVWPELRAMGVGTRTLSRSAALVLEVDAVPEGCSFERSGNWEPTDDDAVFDEYGRSRSETRDGHALHVRDCAASRVDSCTFMPRLPRAGLYDVYAVAPSRGCSRVTVTIDTLHGLERVVWDQRNRPGMWCYLGRFDLPAGHAGWVRLDDSAATEPGETFYCDAVKYVPAEVSD